MIQGQVSQEEKNNTNIEFIQHLNEKIELEGCRKLIFKINDLMLPVTILDLPCIIEANKTTDYKSFYKSSDISQMMFVHNEDLKLKSIEEIDKFDPFKSKDHYFKRITWRKDHDHKYKCRNGIAKCTRNIRFRRFKKKQNYNREEISEVARKLKNIIDNGSIDKKPKEGGETENGDNQSMISQSKSKMTETNKL